MGVGAAVSAKRPYLRTAYLGTVVGRLGRPSSSPYIYICFSFLYARGLEISVLSVLESLVKASGED
jgi:hypothetical protein